MTPRRSYAPGREDAEALALQALAFVATDPAALNRLVAESGLAPTALGDAARDAAFLGGVLDFLLQDEALLLAFCAAEAIAPERPLAARRHLPGAAPE